MPRKDIHKDGVKTQIKKGEVRNPKGRPEGSLNSKTILEKYLSQTVKHTQDDGKEVDVPAYDKGWLLQIADAINPDMDENVRRAAWNGIIDRLEGKAALPVNLGGNEGQNLWTGITIEIVGGTKEPVQNEDELPED